MNGWELFIDTASIRTTAFTADAPAFHRQGDDALGRNCNFKRSLRHFLNVLALATGSVCRVHVILDGAKFPLKAHTHAQRSKALDFDSTLAAARRLDANPSTIAEADKLSH